MKDRQSIKKNKAFGKASSSRGMTMAEMLVTVAIILILASVAFIALGSYQRSLAQLERDGYAKEIFIAAQNHLTMARGEGYLGVTDSIKTAQNKAAEIQKVYGNADGRAGIYYFAVKDGKIGGSKAFADPDKESMLDLMLPFGSIDDTVRLGGNYIIIYQPDTATVLDVFYCTHDGDPGYANFDLTSADYAAVKGLAGKNNKGTRRNYNGSVIGWYGGADTDSLPVPLKAPSINVINGNTLYVQITDTNKKISAAEIKLSVTGLKSKTQVVLPIKTKTVGDTSARFTDRRNDSSVPWDYEFILDDVTQAGFHFAELDNGFIPGEDIEVKALAYSSTAFANIAYSEPEISNSLYQSVKVIKEASSTQLEQISAYVGSFRHLENLDKDVSGTGNGTKFSIVSAFQTDDLVWSDFTADTGNNTVYKNKEIPTQYHHVGYYPVTPGLSLSYDGLRHSVKGITLTGYAAEAGLFGIVADNSKLMNLELIDFDLSGAKYVGALAGYINEGSEITNVIAYNTKAFDADENYSATIDASVDTTGIGCAGGLIGGIVGGHVKYCGAALTVTGRSAAGGLIGRVEDSSGTAALIEMCYSGGHTDKGEYFRNGNRDNPIINVNAAESSSEAGGLIGHARNSVISNCYSTCSAFSAGTAGGLVGQSEGQISHCYSTGLVNGDNNAFIGAGTPTVSNSYFYELINEKNEKVEYRNAGTNTGIVSIDSSRAAYNGFVGPYDSWNEAEPYDSTLDNTFDDRFNLMTVTQLERGGAKSRIAPRKSITEKGSLFVNTHHGDWPAPETVIENK